MPHRGIVRFRGELDYRRTGAIDESTTAEPRDAFLRNARLSVVLMFSALQHRNFRLLWLGQLISFSGSMMQQAAILWHVSLLVPPDRRGLALGIVGLVRVGPILVFSLLGGVGRRPDGRWSADCHGGHRLGLRGERGLVPLRACGAHSHARCAAGCGGR